MITLNTDKGLVRVDSWQEIESRPGFTANLDPKHHTLKAILGRYQFKDKIPCGLSDCHTPHNKGYIVVTTDGIETNIGKDCGRTYFGVEFETLSRNFERDITTKENRDRLWSFSFGLDEIEARVALLRASGAEAVYREMQALITIGKGCPTEVVHRIGSMTKARNSALTKERIATVEELDAIEVREGKRAKGPRYIEEEIARIDGIEALYPENDIRKLLVQDLEEPIRKFKEKDIDALQPGELREAVKWVDSVDYSIRNLDDVVAIGRRLLTSANLTPFLAVLDDDDDKSVFKTYIKGLSSHIGS